MKLVPIKEDGRDWLHLVKFVDAIVICAGVGNAIEPAESYSRKSAACNTVPSRFDYLTTTVSCLKNLINGEGREIQVSLVTVQSRCLREYIGVSPERLFNLAITRMEAP